MGLAIQVGDLAYLLEEEDETNWFLEDMAKLNKFLKSQGLQPHLESPDSRPWDAGMYGYSGLHYLRRIAAHLNIKGPLPAPGNTNAPEDPIIETYYGIFNNPNVSFFGRLIGKKQIIREFDHLIIHSDCEGYYLPQDFPNVLITPEELEITGGIIGSSYRLLEETEKLARALELPPDIDPASDKVLEACDSQGQGNLLWERYGIESFTCLCLRKAAIHSIEQNAVILFC